MPFDEYHYTLYYYDQAENLVKTIPPQGVRPITSTASLDSINQYRLGTAGYNPVYPNGDSLASLYWFNSLNSPVQQATPDGNITHYWYDNLGRLVLSQNAVQAPNLYSYTEYDALNRIIEVGQLSFHIHFRQDSMSHIRYYYTAPLSNDSVEKLARDPASLSYWLSHTKHTQVTHTYYDSVIFHYIPLLQQNLRKRISTITYGDYGSSGTINDTLTTSPYLITFDGPVSETATYNDAIHYSYDIEGNVASMLTDFSADADVMQRYKRTDYYYDLVSGKVNEVVYQHDTTDQFMQEYQYDADNRITDVFTSHDSLYSENDADYSYYLHGPLAREVIGRRQVQGVDYAYTLNGWIKGVNSSMGSAMQAGSTYDMGHDGDVHGANATIGRDAYGFTLDYFNGDYRPIGGTTFEANGLPTVGLYNGNIAGATYAITPLQPKVIGYSYTYDQLNRIRAMQAYITPDTTAYNWSTGTTTQNFREAENYDDNGNILNYLRHGNTRVGPLAMDSLNYNYNKGTNQLAQVLDGVPSSNYPHDIDNETSKRNYEYNAIGQLAKDSAAKIDTIIWNVYGKVQTIRFDSAQDSIVAITFVYDPLGNRIEKIWSRTKVCFPPCVIFYDEITYRTDTTKYSLDAQGNILAIYDRKNDSVWLKEWDIYGSKRIGVVDTTMLVGTLPVTCVCSPPSNPLDSCTLGYLEGQKQYELTNHLGNVLVTLSDKKLPVDTTGTPNIANYYQACIVNAQDYYPFGMIEPGRSYSLTGDSSYRFGFNGKLIDNDIYGKDNSYDYGARMYDPRLGRFLSIDPLAKKYPMLTPYQFASNTPILSTDIDGKEAGIDPNALGRAAQESAQAGDNSAFGFAVRYTKNFIFNLTGINGLLDLAEEGTKQLQQGASQYANAGNNSAGYNKNVPDDIKKMNQTQQQGEGLQKMTSGATKVVVASVLIVAMAIPDDPAAYGIAEVTEQGGAKIVAVVDSKIAGQMEKRGWDNKMINSTIKNATKTMDAVDRTANNEAATAYLNKDGSYVVLNNKTKKVVQVSDRTKSGWKPDPSFKEKGSTTTDKK